MDKNPETLVTSEQLLTVAAAVRGIDEAARQYAVRFVTANAELTDEELVAKWVADLEGREEAARKEIHRQKRVVNEFLELLPPGQRETVAGIVGVETIAEAPEAAGETNEQGE